MRIAITGASGFLGRQLVPLLLERSAQLLLIGRDPAALRTLFPRCDAVGYGNLAAAAGFDSLLHLAVINNDQSADPTAIQRVNVDLPASLCREASILGIGTFIFVSSTHALDLGNLSEYAASKRLALGQLSGIAGIDKYVLYLPAIVGNELAGTLGWINRLPRSLRTIALLAAGSMKPTVRVDRIVEAIEDLQPENGAALTEMIVTNGQRHNSVFSKVKRFTDLAFAFLIILLLWWLMLIIWVAIRLQSPGPGIFRQERVGRNEQVFTCLKFRTMYLSTPNAGTHEVSAASVTPLGHFLRRTKLDELPQVINILRNDMSLVGPRPCLPTQHAMIAERQSQGVFAIKPGITGLAQIRGIDMSEPAALAACDREYLLLQSLLLDLRIIIQTARGSGSGDNVATIPSGRTADDP